MDLEEGPSEATSSLYPDLEVAALSSLVGLGFGGSLGWLGMLVRSTMGTPDFLFSGLGLILVSEIALFSAGLPPFCAV